MANYIKVRGEFMRVARAFAHGSTDVFDIRSTIEHKGLSGILLEPHPSGEGINIVSTDGGVLCLQHDTEGEVSGRTLIEGLSKPNAVDLSNGQLGSRCFVFEAGVAKIRKEDGRVESTLPDVRVTVGPSYPDWQQIVPTADQIESMVEGYPGILNIAYLSILARLWDDRLSNCRTVRILSYRTISNISVLQFPWRPNMLVVVAPLSNSQGMPTTPDLLKLINQGVPDDDDGHGL